MTREQTRRIRETALEDDELTANARLMLALIIDWHHKKKGCVMHDSTLGDKLGISTRTARRRRHELIKAGYLTEKHGAHRRELVPAHPDSSDRTPDTSDQTADTGDDAPDSSDNPPPDTSDQHREINNPEGVSEPRAQEDRWDFLPDYRQRWLPEIRSEAGDPDENPDVLSIAERFLSDPDVDLPSTVDDHLSRRDEDEVIAAYVIAGRAADDPIAYADKIIREGWKESSGDGAATQLPDDDQDVMFFGSTR